MRVLIIAAFLVLAGCASNPYGNYSKAGRDLQAVMAMESVDRLAATYAPAKTTMVIGQKVKDGYGGALISQLREKGFAVVEPWKLDMVEYQMPDNGKSLTYLINELGAGGDADNIYQVTLRVDTTRISRAFAEVKGKIMPMGFWALKE